MKFIKNTLLFIFCVAGGLLTAQSDAVAGNVLKTPPELGDIKHSVSSVSNQKSANPRGYGEDNLIEANTDITYVIEFQNVTNDTVRSLTVLDTICAALDLSTFVLNDISHTYEFSISEDSIMIFHFPNIQLSDSVSNPHTSKGYITYTISQRQDLSEGTYIENSASFYFGSNDVIHSNTAFHNVAKDFLPTAIIQEEQASEWPVSVSPNPVTDLAVFSFNNTFEGNGELHLFDIQGQVLRQQSFGRTNQVQLATANLSSGVYFYRILVNNHWISGKLIK